MVYISTLLYRSIIIFQIVAVSIYFLYYIPCRGGEIGKHAGFKIQFLRKWGFDPPPRHQVNYEI